MARRGGWARGILGTVVVLLLALPGAGAAVEVSYGASLLSHYVWRGIALTDDPVFQPSVRIAHDRGISFEVWGNVDLGDDNDTPGEITEARLVLDYRRRVGAVEIGAGVIEYLFPNTPFPGTREVYLDLAVDALVAPRLEIHYDVDEIEGAYLRLALAYRRDLRPRWSAALEASAGWADAAFAIGRQAGLHDAGLELQIERSAGPLELCLLAGWTDTLNPNVLPEQPASFWTGLSVALRL